MHILARMQLHIHIHKHIHLHFRSHFSPSYVGESTHSCLLIFSSRGHPLAFRGFVPQVVSYPRPGPCFWRFRAPGGFVPSMPRGDDTMKAYNLGKNQLRLFYVPKILAPFASNFRHDPILRQRVRQMYREMSGPLGQQLEQEHATYYAQWRIPLSMVSKRARAEYEIAKRLGVRGRARDRYIG